MGTAPTAPTSTTVARSSRAVRRPDGNARSAKNVATVTGHSASTPRLKASEPSALWSATRAHAADVAMSAAPSMLAGRRTTQYAPAAANPAMASARKSASPHP